MPETIYWLQRLYSNYASGRGNFPELMGLNSGAWSLLSRTLQCDETLPAAAEIAARRALATTLLQPRLAERDQLALWLKGYAQSPLPVHWLLASAAMGFNHLWEDLGLDSRAELGELMQECFPQLVVMNNKKMRWKKFFYRQRCLQQEGDLVCRSPSCDDCCEWVHCFAPEGEH
ncbi:nitrogen fixation protein NifQ [Mangrovibacter phragmitis]|uniref:Nitrogen fixation protein NifQ n=1 Tax=Mangrovibacter phragmitis TaxID=1691903 RepID=A0A1B7KY39_9ENTR|nr:nitrogen fixation protein NifQ [Mangrovibacter phragmitis]OAT74946.1 nitrogen fixation protein NifQ [Mangrovibacter phragmitis]